MVVATSDETRLARRIGSFIKTARVASGLPRDQVARSAGLTVRELSGYELGKKIPSRGDLRALAGACGIHVDELLPKELVDSLT
jgi:transcriptional regulator with XRE-family HTH domain